MAWSIGVWEVLSGLGDGRHAREFWCCVCFGEDFDNGMGGGKKFKGFEMDVCLISVAAVIVT
jgi:hypothetical protein